MPIVTMKQLLEAGIHFGHQTRRWNPKMARFIYGQRNGIYIIDLQKTMRQLQKAYVSVRDIVANGGDVLFVGTKKQAQETVAREAQRCGMYYVNVRWLGGTLTNWETIRQSIRKLESLEEMDSSGQMDVKFKKKEAINMRKLKDKLNHNLKGIKAMPGLPQAMFVIDAKKEAIAVREAERLGITCIAVVDTNSDPDVVPVPIPGNDDAIRAVGLFCSVIADAVMDGRMKAEKLRADEEKAERLRAKEAAASRAAAEKEAQAAGESAATESSDGEKAAVEPGEAAAETETVESNEE